MAQARSLTATIWTLFGLVLVAGAVLFLARSCGPSALAKAFGNFDSKVRLRLDDEARFWNQLADAAAEQVDEPGVAKYRTFLETKAVPYYREMEGAIRAIEPGQPRLAEIRDVIVQFVRCRQDFVGLELRRLDETRGSIGPITALQGAFEARDEAMQTYFTAVGDDFPDGNLGTLTTIYDTFMSEVYHPAVAGKIELDAALELLRKKFIPAIRKLRDGRFEETPKGALFRKWVIVTDELFARFEVALPFTIPARKATQRVEEVQEEMNRLQTDFQRLFKDVQRDK